jgi:thiamine biosynthesis protein ThiS
VVASLNEKVVPPEEYASIKLNDSDVLNIMSFVGGG